MNTLKISFGLIFLSFLTICRSQNPVANYYQQINEAEIAICENDYHTALNIYKKAFKYEGVIFAKDYYNAFVCAVDLKKYKLAEYYYHELLKKGILKSNLAKFFETNDEKWKTVEKKYATFSPIFDSIYIKKIRELMDKDQRVRTYCASVGNGYTYHQSCIDTVKFVDSINYQDLSILFDEKGVIVEDKVGIKHPKGNLKYDLIIEHNLMHNRPYVLEAMKPAVLSGKIPPFFYSVWKDYDVQNHHSENFQSEHLGTHNVFATKEEVYLFVEPDESGIDKRRSEIYLSTMEDFRKKITYQLKKPDFYLIHSRMLPIVTMDKSLKKSVLDMAESKGETVIILKK